jgi:hypothetical protein
VNFANKGAVMSFRAGYALRAVVWNADDIDATSASQFRVSLDLGDTTQIDGSANDVWFTDNLVVTRTYRFLKVLLDAGSGPKQTARPDRARFHVPGRDACHRKPVLGHGDEL